MRSFWEKDTLDFFDVIVVGGGILGMWTAIEMRRRDPKIRIAVIERGVIPRGATSRNAGFVCFGSVTEIFKNIESFGMEKARELILKRWQGIQKIRSFFSDEEIDHQYYGGHELIFDDELIDTKVAMVNELIYPVFDQEVFHYNPDLLQSSGFGGPNAIISNRKESQIHSGLLIQALQKKLGELDIRLLTGYHVENYQNILGRIAVHGIDQPTLYCDQLVYCTNAFIPNSSLSVKPGRGQVLITKPIAGLKFQGSFHMEEGYYYFRNIGDRVLFGGGRNLDFVSETTTDFSLNMNILSELENILRDRIIPDHSFEIEHRWSGIMAFSEDQQPVVNEIDPKVYYVMNCNGMGISLSPITAEEVARRIVGA